MAKAMGPSEIHRSLLGFPGTGPMYRLKPTPLIGPVSTSVAQSSGFCVVFIDYSYYHWVYVTDVGHFVH